MVLVGDAGQWCSSVVLLVNGASRWFWSVVLVSDTGQWWWSVVLVDGAATQW